MIAFKRTKSGLANQHLFHNADLIVFLEGGEICYTKPEAYQGNFNDQTNDILFWKNIFQNFRKIDKVKFKSVGSKTTIREIALDIVDGNIETVMVAMDKEFDDILSKLIAHPNVIYTNGYSWENDVWNEHVIHTVLSDLSAIEISEKIISENFTKFLKQIKIGVYSDAYLFSKSSSFFSRSKGYMSVINCNPIDLPHVKPEVLQLQMSNKKVKGNTVYAFAKRKSLAVRQCCYGHLLADYCFQVIMHYLKNRLKLPTLHKDLVYRMGINKYFQHFFNQSDSYSYYQSILAQTV